MATNHVLSRLRQLEETTSVCGQRKRERGIPDVYDKLILSDDRRDFLQPFKREPGVREEVGGNYNLRTSSSTDQNPYSQRKAHLARPSRYPLRAVLIRNPTAHLQAAYAPSQTPRTKPHQHASPAQRDQGREHSPGHARSAARAASPFSRPRPSMMTCAPSSAWSR